jgi:myo-inositol-1(or 4)-monophosphatase
MNSSNHHRALAFAIQAAKTAGALMRKNLNSAKKVNEASQHDIKLDLDVRCQKLIERTLRKAFPAYAILGEEGTLGDIQSEYRWVVDPIDGTVNFTYGIPHCCVSIALQKRRDAGGSPSPKHPDLDYTTVVGVVYDPFCDELWTAVVGQKARLNGRPIRVSTRGKMEEAIVSMGFAKYTVTMQVMLPLFNNLVPRVRKIRLMGAAALSMVYVASGRFDAYAETGVRLWDIAAGGLIIECAGGEFYREPMEGDHTYRIIANNGLLRQKIEKLA